MPEVIEIKPKGIYIKIEFSLEELILLKAAMDKSSIEVNLANKDEKAAHDFYTKDFYNLVNALVEDLKKDGAR